MDSKNTQWSVTINGGTVKRCATLLDIDLGQPLEGEPPWLTRVDTDIAFFVDLVYVICKPEADDRSISDVQFAERLDGNALWLARQALFEELDLFFQSRHRAEVVAAIKKQQQLVLAAVDMAAERTERIDVTELLRGHLGEPGEDSASTPP